MAKSKSKKYSAKRGATDTRSCGSSNLLSPEQVQRDSAVMSSQSDRSGKATTKSSIKLKRVSFSSTSESLPSELLADVSLPKFRTPFRDRLRIAMVGLLMQFLLCLDAALFDFWFLSGAADWVVKVLVLIRNLMGIIYLQADSESDRSLRLSPRDG